MTFFIPSIQFFFGPPRALLCLGIHFNPIPEFFWSKKFTLIQLLYYNNISYFIFRLKMSHVVRSIKCLRLEAKNNRFLLRNPKFLEPRCSQAQNAQSVAEESSHLCLGLSTFHAFPASPYPKPLPSHLPLFLHSSILWTVLMMNNLSENHQALPCYFLSHTSKHTSVCFLDTLHLLVPSELSQKYLFTLSTQLYDYTLSCLQN
jgi:hypothetical protein